MQSLRALLSTSGKREEGAEKMQMSWYRLAQQFTYSSEQGWQAAFVLVGSEGQSLERKAVADALCKALFNDIAKSPLMELSQWTRKWSINWSLELQYMESVLHFIDQTHSLLLEISRNSILILYKHLKLLVQSLWSHFRLLNGLGEQPNRLQKFPPIHQILSLAVCSTTNMILSCNSALELSETREFVSILFSLSSNYNAVCQTCVSGPCTAKTAAKYSLVELEENGFSFPAEFQTSENLKDTFSKAFEYQTSFSDLSLLHRRFCSLSFSEKNHIVQIYDSVLIAFLRNLTRVSDWNILLGIFSTVFSDFPAHFILLKQTCTDYIHVLHSSSQSEHRQSLVVLYHFISRQLPASSSILDLIDQRVSSPKLWDGLDLIVAKSSTRILSEPFKSLDFTNYLFSRAIINTHGDSLVLPLISFLFKALWKQSCIDDCTLSILHSLALLMETSAKAIESVSSLFEDSPKQVSIKIDSLIDSLPVSDHCLRINPVDCIRLVVLGNEGLNPVTTCLKSKEFLEKGNWCSGVRIIEICQKSVKMCADQRSFNELRDRFKAILEPLVNSYCNLDISHQAKLLLNLIYFCELDFLKDLLYPSVSPAVSVELFDDEVMDNDVVIPELGNLISIKRSKHSYPLLQQNEGSILIPIMVQFRHSRNELPNEIFAISLEFERFHTIQPVQIPILKNGEEWVHYVLKVDVSHRHLLHEEVLAHIKFTDTDGILYRGYSLPVALSLLDFSHPVDIEDLDSLPEMQLHSVWFQESTSPRSYERLWSRLQSFLCKSSATELQAILHFPTWSYLSLSISLAPHSISIGIQTNDRELLRYVDHMIDTLVPSESHPGA